MSYPVLLGWRYAACHDNGQKRSLLLQFVCSFTQSLAIELGHHDVCDNNIWLLALDEIKTLLTICGSKDLIALVLEFEFDHSPDMGFIVYDQNPFIVFQGNTPPSVA